MRMVSARRLRDYSMSELVALRYKLDDLPLKSDGCMHEQAFVMLHRVDHEMRRRVGAKPCDVDCGEH